ncbi:hypothetical protein ACHWQZ_G003360 [Mnemiopsis leidyi]
MQFMGWSLTIHIRSFTLLLLLLLHICVNGKWDYCIREDKDYQGGDIKMKSNVDNVADCVAICQAHPSCILISYQAEFKRCWAKNAEIVGNYNDKPGIRSVRMSCIQYATTGFLENVATKGIASQVDDYNPSLGSAKLAIDGDTGGTYQSNQVSHTATRGTDAWWKVSLPHPYFVRRIVIYGRTDCCIERMDGVTVKLDDTLIGTIQYTNGKTVYELSNVDTSGSEVKIVGGSSYVHLAEVQVLSAETKTSFPTVDIPDKSYCYKRGISLHGGDMTTLSLSTIADCLAQCQKTSGCIGITTNTSTANTCTLKDSTSSGEQPDCKTCLSVRVSCVTEENRCLFDHSSLLSSNEEKHPYSTVEDCKEKCDSSDTPCLGFTVLSGEGEESGCYLKHGILTKLEHAVLGSASYFRNQENNQCYKPGMCTQ